MRLKLAGTIERLLGRKNDTHEIAVGEAAAQLASETEAAPLPSDPAAAHREILRRLECGASIPIQFSPSDEVRIET